MKPANRGVRECQQFLQSKYTCSIPNKKRIRVRVQYPHRRLAVTRMPKLDNDHKQILPTAARVTDKELARIQTFVLDGVSPLVCLMEAETAEKCNPG